MTSVAKLVRGKWPHLLNLNLADNCLDNDAIRCLVQEACWPHLSSLRLQGNDIDAVGVQTLTEADWKLRSLTLGIKTMSETTLRILGIDPAYLPTSTEYSKEESLSLRVPRRSKWTSYPCGELRSIWPNLWEVQVVYSPAQTEAVIAVAIHT